MEPNDNNSGLPDIWLIITIEIISDSQCLKTLQLSSMKSSDMLFHYSATTSFMWAMIGAQNYILSDLICSNCPGGSLHYSIAVLIFHNISVSVNNSEREEV